MTHADRPDLQLLALIFLGKHSPMTLENRTWFVELGPTTMDMDFCMTAPLLVNGKEVGRVDMMELQDHTYGSK